MPKNCSIGIQLLAKSSRTACTWQVLTVIVASLDFGLISLNFFRFSSESLDCQAYWIILHLQTWMEVEYKASNWSNSGQQDRIAGNCQSEWRCRDHKSGHLTEHELPTSESSRLEIDTTGIRFGCVLEQRILLSRQGVQETAFDSKSHKFMASLTMAGSVSCL